MKAALVSTKYIQHTQVISDWESFLKGISLNRPVASNERVVLCSSKHSVCGKLANSARRRQQMLENAGKRFYSANLLLDYTVTAKIKSTTRTWVVLLCEYGQSHLGIKRETLQGDRELS